MRYLLIIIIALPFFSCSSTKLYNWQQYDESVYNYIYANDEKSTEKLLKQYEKIMSKTGSRKVPAPGVCADYGYILIKKGEIEKGKILLKKEIQLYPESATLINAILKRIEK